jgi:putative membrane protein
MVEQQKTEQQRFAVHPTSDSHFSWIRTRLSVERTLLSYIRTATALIGFGFTIVQFFDRFSAMDGVTPPMSPHAPRYLGLALIFAGMAVLATSLVQFRSISRYLRSDNFALLAETGQKSYASASVGISILLLIIGTLVFFSVLLRLA